MQWIEFDYNKPISQQFISLLCWISFRSKGLSHFRPQGLTRLALHFNDLRDRNHV